MMTTFDPCRVLHILVQHFGLPTIQSQPTRFEQKVANRFASILQESCLGDLLVENSEDFSIQSVQEDGDPDWSAGEDDELMDCSNNDGIQFSKSTASIEKVKEAILHYRNTAKGSRPLSSMTNRYAFIKTECDLQKLRVLEKKEELVADRSNRLKALASAVYDNVMKKMNMGISLRDQDVRRLALVINKEQNFVDGFKASLRWVQLFKSNVGLVTRKVTTFTSVANYRNKDDLDAISARYINDVRAAMDTVPLSLICNCDQSGFQKEIPRPRSLAPIGIKRVERVVMSTSATTHSYTVLPMLFADGHLGDQLCVVLQEVNGRFPQKGHFEASNLYVMAGSSHIMTKRHMVEWMQNVVFSGASTMPSYLMLDSWTSFRDHNTIRELAPIGMQLTVSNIPPGTTSRIQPLDVYFFRTFKQFVKRIHGHIQVSEIQFVAHKRDNILKVLSQVYWTFCAERFRKFLQYSWYAAGYTSTHPGDFLTPLQICFPDNMDMECSTDDCNGVVFIRCAHCDAEFCFQHFIDEFHRC